MKHRIYVVAVARKDGKLPGAEKIVNGQIFHDLRDAERQLEAVEYADDHAPVELQPYRNLYCVYEATIEIQGKVKP